MSNSHAHIHRPATFFFFFLPGNNQLFNTSLKLPAWLWICQAQLPVSQPATQTHALMQKSINTIFACLHLMRNLPLTCSSLPAVAVGVSMPCLSLTLAGSCRIFFFSPCEAVMCAQFGELFHSPFWRR